ncbi:MAG TPA: cupredoxin domain-containing protein [Acidimicrobiia bacterium]|nr:cupredoxin domain-containing protein [Acidimicrobiia bacterium]
MRKLFALTGAAIAAIALAGGTALAGVPTKSKPPVTLEGKVNNKGEKTVKKGKISIEADDFYFKPTFEKAKLGSKVTVKLKNEGKTQHTFTIASLGIDQTLDPDQKATVDVTLPTDGALAFYCRFHGPTTSAPGASNQGMQGAFFSKKGESLSTGGGAAAATATTGAAPATTTPSTSSGGGGGGYGY